MKFRTYLTFAVIFPLTACSADPPPDAVQLAVPLSPNEVRGLDDGDSHAPPAVTVALQGAQMLRTVDASEPLALVVTNTTDAPKRVTVDLFVRRHRGSKGTPLPTVTVPAKGSTNISLPAAALPNRSNGAAQVYAVTARYTDGGGDRVDPGSAFTVGWDAAFGSAWIGGESDAPEIGRRALASVARRAGKSVPPDLDGRNELLASLQSAIDVEDSDLRTGQAQRRKANADDVFALPLTPPKGRMPWRG